MKIIDVVPLAIPAITVIRFARFCDKRGYFTEPFRSSDLASTPLTWFLKGVEFPQTNESWSRPGDWLARLGRPLARLAQRTFTREALAHFRDLVQVH